jgi:hypothetical protein
MLPARITKEQKCAVLDKALENWPAILTTGTLYNHVEKTYCALGWLSKTAEEVLEVKCQYHNDKYDLAHRIMGGHGSQSRLTHLNDRTGEHDRSEKTKAYVARVKEKMCAKE